VLFVAYIAYRESRRAVPTFGDADVLEAADSPELVGAAAGGGHRSGGNGGAGLYETGELAEVIGIEAPDDAPDRAPVAAEPGAPPLTIENNLQGRSA